MERIEYGTSTLEFALEFTERKSMAIEVHPDKSVVVKAPLNADRTEIDKRILKRGSWIVRQQKYFDTFLPRSPQREYVGGESHRYLGRKYVLKIRIAQKRDVKLKGGELYVFTSIDHPDAVKALLSAWYYNHAMPKFDEVFSECLPLFNRFDIGNPKMEIRRMKNRWGSCTPSGKILLNPELIKAPKRCIQYVVIHELCHLVIPSHSRAFYELLGEQMPGWERWKERLEMNG